MIAPAHVFVADWGKEAGKRVVYRVDVGQKCVAPCNPHGVSWTMSRLIDAASPYEGPVLVLIDVAIGLPGGLFTAMRDAAGRSDLGNFLHLLRAHLPGEWLGDVRRPADWGVRTPYIHVPAGDGSLTEFRTRAARVGVSLSRAIDLQTAGRSPLILSGIPGTVGSGSRDVIRSLGSLDAEKVAVWPFDGPLDALLASGRVVLGEIYPRALYGHVLLEAPHDERCLLAVGKTNRRTRTAALSHLERINWHQGLGVALDPILFGRASENEDDFDAYLSALGVLRLILERVPLEDDALRSRTGNHGRPLLDGVAEGGMLGVLATQLDRGQSTFAAPAPAEMPESTDTVCADRSASPSRGRPSGPWVRVTSGTLTNAAKHSNYRQISFSGLLPSEANIPAWVEIECEGRPYTLTIGDTTCCWRSHQISTIEDFDTLYDLLSGTPDRCVPVDLAGDLSPAGEGGTEADGV